MPYFLSLHKKHGHINGKFVKTLGKVHEKVAKYSRWCNKFPELDVTKYHGNVCSNIRSANFRPS